MHSILLFICVLAPVFKGVICLNTLKYFDVGVCSDVLLAGSIRDHGLYFITRKEGKHLQGIRREELKGIRGDELQGIRREELQGIRGEELLLPYRSNGTAAYSDLGGHYLYHKQNIGWVIAQKQFDLEEEFEVVVFSNVTDMNVVRGGEWANGVTIICLDRTSCTQREKINKKRNNKLLQTKFPFNGETKSKDGTFCAAVVSFGRMFDYINMTDRSGFPIYSSGTEYLVRSEPGDRSSGSSRSSSSSRSSRSSRRSSSSSRSSTHNYKIISFHDGLERRKEVPFDANQAVCTSTVFDAIPASSTHAHWQLPEDSLDNATSWELGMTIKILESTIDTYFVAVRWAPGGYSGFQDLPDNRKAPSFKLALVSMWDNGEDIVETLYINSKAGVTQKSFGGEGTGMQAWMDYPWTIGVPTSMKIKGKLVNSTTNQWEVDGYVQALDDPLQWIHMVTFSRTSPIIPGQPGSNIRGTPLATWGFSVFIEDWNRPECAHGYMYKRSAEFICPHASVNGAPVLLSSPEFSTSRTGSDTYGRHLVVQKEIGPAGSGSVLLSTGGPPEYN